MTIKEFFSFKQNKFFWINLIAMVIVVALVPVSYTHLTLPTT